MTDVDGFPDGFFARQDETPDPVFYGSLRLVTHIDDDAIAAVADATHKAARPMDNTSGTISQRKRAARVFADRALRALRVA